ncbi:MAG: amidohydrolase [Clostridiaceae bacterium]|nr:amidohydrolase [Clostridiaceae bacterium]
MGYYIKDITVLTWEQGIKIITNANVKVVGSKITYIGTEDQDDSGTDIIDGKGKVLMPGLVNAHTHIPMTLLRSYADDMAPHTWLYEHIFPVEAKLTPEDVYWGSQLALLEMIAGGTTCFADMYCFIDKIAEATAQSGLRGLLSRGLINGAVLEDYSDDDRLNEAVSVFHEWDGAMDGRIRIALAPHAVYTCSPQYIKAIRNMAEKLNAYIHVHVDETVKEHNDCLQQYGKTPVKHLYDIGLFDLPTIAAHCVHVTDKDMDLMKEKNVAFVHNPGSNLKLASGVAPVPDALNKGLNVALGTDGASSNNNLNMWEEMNLASLIHKGSRLDPTAVNAAEAFKMATVNGASALGFSDTGQIKEGFKADMIIIDAQKPYYYPKHKLISNIAYAAQASDVETVFVDGKMLYHRGEYKTLDKEKILFNVEKTCERLFSK